MSVHTTCSKCGREYNLPDDQRGKKVRCKDCGHVFQAIEGGEGSAEPEVEGVTSSRSTGSNEKTGVSRSSRPREEREDDVRPAKKKRPPRSSSSDDGTLKFLLIGGGVAMLLVVGCCGGIGTFIYFKVKGAVDTIAPSSVDQALENLQSDNPLARIGAINYFQHNPVDESRRKEVAQALEAQLSNPDEMTRSGCMRALIRWGSKDNTPAVLRVLNTPSNGPFMSDTEKAAMEALGTWKDERGAPVLIRNLSHAFGHGDAEKGLRLMGKAAEPEVLKSMHDPSQDVATRCRGLLERDYATTEEKLLTQTSRDLRSNELLRQKQAANWLLGRSTVPPVAEKRREVASALDPLIQHPDAQLQDVVLRALGRWATVDNAASLTDAYARPQHRGHAETALRLIGPPAEPEVLKLLQDPDQNVKVQACRLLGYIGTKASFPELDRLAMEKTGQVAPAARSARAAIERRGR